MEQMKTCSKCKRILPADFNHFTKRKTTKDGLEIICKECRGHRFTKNKVINNKEHKPCSKCGHVLPNNYYYFMEDKRVKSGLAAMCRECKGCSFLKPLPTPKENYKFCSICGNEYPRNLNNFYKSINHVDGLTSACKECTRKQKRKHWDAVICNIQKRKARKKLLLSEYTKEQWAYCKNTFNYECSYCGRRSKNLEQDHIIPVTKGGHYINQNIVPSCRRCNSSKSNKDMEDWYKKQPFFSQERLDKIHQWMGVNNNIQQLKII